MDEMSLLTTATVEQGAVALSGPPYIVHLSEGCVIWEVDCRSKYAEPILAIGSHDAELRLVPSQHTLGLLNKGGAQTVITVPFPDEDIWSVHTDGGRYSFQLIMYKRGIGVDNAV